MDCENEFSATFSFRIPSQKTLLNMSIRVWWMSIVGPRPAETIALTPENIFRLLANSLIKTTAFIIALHRAIAGVHPVVRISRYIPILNWSFLASGY